MVGVVFFVSKSLWELRDKINFKYWESQSHVGIFNNYYYMASSASGQDESNPAL